MNTSIRARITSAAAAIVLGVLIGISPHEAAAAPAAPFLFSYTFDNHLALGGGYYTMNGWVFVVVKSSDGAVMFSQDVRAKPHSITPGGAVYVQTSIAAPCAPGNKGYARAYDRTTQKWSPRLPVAVCQRID